MNSSPPTTDTADPTAQLDAAFRRAIVAVAGDDFADASPVIRPAQRPEYGDFQVNGTMALAKAMGANPREIGQKLIDAVDLGDLAEAPELAGPGFINIRLRPEALGGMLAAMDDTALGVPHSRTGEVVALDLCGVNVAKQMHVGHLRSCIIGDALARVLERAGSEVHRENHLGDWGLPIAMVLHELRAAGTDLDALTLVDLDRAYRDAQLSVRADASGLATARTPYGGPHRVAELEAQQASADDALTAAKATLVKLQEGDAELRRDWQKLIDCTLAALYEALAIMQVQLGPENNRGESFYRDRLPGAVEAFVDAGLAREDDGALVVTFADRERPMLLRKSDGGFLYATTDVTAVRYRVQELGAQRVIYVVDARQRDHFKDVFDAVRLIGWDRRPDGAVAELVHIPFGAVLGKDKRPLKTRSGENVTLKSLLDEAVTRGTAEVVERAQDPSAPTHGLDEATLGDIGRAVGIGAIKFADLSNDLIRDYVFDFKRMLAFEGKTGPYIQYAHARICSIFTRAEIDPASTSESPLLIREVAEKQLALLLLRYPGVVTDVATSLEPHRLCNYLYELAEAYSTFYQQCPVLKSDDEAIRSSRLRLCNLVRRVIADGLGLLGIDAPQCM